MAWLLLEAGADPSLAGESGSSPLMAAATAGQVAVLRLLLRRGIGLGRIVVVHRRASTYPYVDNSQRVVVGPGRRVALHHRASTAYQIR